MGRAEPRNLVRLQEERAGMVLLQGCTPDP